MAVCEKCGVEGIHFCFGRAIVVLPNGQIVSLSEWITMLRTQDVAEQGERIGRRMMATREEMGKALFEIERSRLRDDTPWEEYSEGFRQLECDIAERFAAWLREQEGSAVRASVENAIKSNKAFAEFTVRHSPKPEDQLHVAGRERTFIGIDPARGEDASCIVVARKNSDGTLTVLSTYPDASKRTLGPDDICGMPTSCCEEMNHPGDGDKVTSHFIREHGPLTCPKGHVLTHPEDVRRRYCGECRSFLP